MGGIGTGVKLGLGPSLVSLFTGPSTPSSAGPGADKKHHLSRRNYDPSFDRLYLSHLPVFEIRAFISNYWIVPPPTFLNPKLVHPSSHPRPPSSSLIRSPSPHALVCRLPLAGRRRSPWPRCAAVPVRRHPSRSSSLPSPP